MSRGATNKKLEAKIEAKLKEITKRSENRKCMDCREKGPRYVVLNFNIFVCSSCSGIHREFQHRAVGVSMSKFTMEQVKALDEGGNKVAKKLWMSRWDANEFPEPENHDIPKIREFIRKKYIEKQWYKKKKSKKSKSKDKGGDDWGDTESSNFQEVDTEEDTRERRRALRKAEKKALKEARRQSKSGGSDDLSGGLDSLSFDDKDSEKKSKKSKKKKDKNIKEPSQPESDDLFALDWSSGSSSQPPQQQQGQSSTTDFGNFDAFGATNGVSNSSGGFGNDDFSGFQSGGNPGLSTTTPGGSFDNFNSNGATQNMMGNPMAPMAPMAPLQPMGQTDGDNNQGDAGISQGNSNGGIARQPSGPDVFSAFEDLVTNDLNAQKTLS